MSFLRLARSEFERMTSSFKAIITIVGLAIIPVLYAGVYLYANWDPYDNLDNLDAALVNQDSGAEFDGEFQRIGDDVVDELVSDVSFNWEQVDSAAEANDGVSDGQYQFALIIPEGFSEALASPGSFENAEQANINVTTNEANNYLLSSIVNVLAFEIHGSVSEQVGQETADQMLTGFGQIHQDIVTAAEGASDLEDGAEELHDGLGDLHSGADEFVDGAEELNQGAETLSTSSSELTEGISELSDGATELSTGASSLAAGLSELEEGATSLETATEDLAEGASDVSTSVSALAEGAEQVAEGNEQLAASTEEASDLLHEFETSAEGRVDQAVTDLIDSGLITEEQAEEAHQALSGLAEDSELIDRAQTARTDLQEAQESITELAEGSRTVADGLSELSTGATELSTGASELAETAPTLSENITSARQGADSLNTGASDLADGASQAHTGATELSNGAAELAEATSEAEDGANDLHDGIVTAESGSADLVDGTGELLAGLDSGAEEVPNPDSDQRSELSHVIGNPLQVSHTTQAEAGNYGAGMAPFFLALSLWIGALVMLQVLRSASPRALASNVNPFSLALGSWLPFLLLSVGQSVLLYTAVVLGLGLSPAHPWLAFVILLMASMAFSALVHGMVALLGNPGKMLAIFLLVLQLVSSGGTFPPETLPGPLQALHHVLPMTYVIDGLRHVIYGGDLAAFSTTIGALLLTTLVGLGLLVFALYQKKMWTLERLHPAFQEAE